MLSFLHSKTNNRQCKIKEQKKLIFFRVYYSNARQDIRLVCCRQESLPGVSPWIKVCFFYHAKVQVLFYLGKSILWFNNIFIIGNKEEKKYLIRSVFLFFRQKWKRKATQSEKLPVIMVKVELFLALRMMQQHLI